MKKAAIAQNQYTQKRPDEHALRVFRDTLPEDVPLSAAELRERGLGEAFVDDMRNWKRSVEG